ncbi:hypothetical protein FB446DRAFT_834297, partial [Lentinula raphanica]
DFDRAQWEAIWKETAINILREEWDLRYKGLIDESTENITTTNTFDIDMGLFEELDQFGKTSADDAILDEYLKSPTDANVDPINYWVSHLDLPGAKATAWGMLARMALDFLSAPATSTDVERLFSHGGSQGLYLKTKYLIISGTLNHAEVRHPLPNACFIIILLLPLFFTVYTCMFSHGSDSGYGLSVFLARYLRHGSRSYLSGTREDL